MTRDPTDKARLFIERIRQKLWVPYEGPQGGEGWQNIDTGDVVYDDEPPGQAVADSMPPGPDEWDEADSSDFEVGDWGAFEVDGEVYMGQISEVTTSEGFGNRDDKHYAHFEAVSPERLVGESMSINPYRDGVQRAPSDSGSPVDGEDPASLEAAEEDDGGASVGDIESWDSMNDDDVRAVIDEVWSGDGDDTTRNDVYDIIGTPPLNDDEYEDAGLNPFDMSSTTSDVATEYGTVEEFQRARESGELERSITDVYEAMSGERPNLSDDIIETAEDEVLNHVVFDLIWHHQAGRSDALYD